MTPAPEPAIFQSVKNPSPACDQVYFMAILQQPLQYIMEYFRASTEIVQKMETDDTPFHDNNVDKCRWPILFGDKCKKSTPIVQHANQ